MTKSMSGRPPPPKHPWRYRGFKSSQDAGRNWVWGPGADKPRGGQICSARVDSCRRSEIHSLAAGHNGGNPAPWSVEGDETGRTTELEHAAKHNGWRWPLGLGASCFPTGRCSPGEVRRPVAVPPPFARGGRCSLSRVSRFHFWVYRSLRGNRGGGCPVWEGGVRDREWQRRRNMANGNEEEPGGASDEGIWRTATRESHGGEDPVMNHYLSSGGFVVIDRAQAVTNRWEQQLRYKGARVPSTSVTPSHAGCGGPWCVGYFGGGTASALRSGGSLASSATMILKLIMKRHRHRTHSGLSGGQNEAIRDGSQRYRDRYQLIPRYGMPRAHRLPR